MRTCSVCGGAAPSEAVYCPSCGTRLEESMCASCRTPSASSAAFCAQCGEPLGAEPTSVLDGRPASARSLGAWLMGLGVLIGLGVLLWHSNYRYESPSAWLALSDDVDSSANMGYAIAAVLGLVGLVLRYAERQDS